MKFVAFSGVLSPKLLKIKVDGTKENTQFFSITDVIVEWIMNMFKLN